jgi:hypothetical protein
MKTERWSIGVVENWDGLLFRADVFRVGPISTERATLKRAEARAPMNTQKPNNKGLAVILRLSLLAQSLILRRKPARNHG